MAVLSLFVGSQEKSLEMVALYGIASYAGGWLTVGLEAVDNEASHSSFLDRPSATSVTSGPTSTPFSLVKLVASQDRPPVTNHPPSAVTKRSGKVGSFSEVPADVATRWGPLCRGRLSRERRVVKWHHNRQIATFFASGLAYHDGRLRANQAELDARGVDRF